LRSDRHALQWPVVGMPPWLYQCVHPPQLGSAWPAIARICHDFLQYHVAAHRALWLHYRRSWSGVTAADPTVLAGLEPAGLVGTNVLWVIPVALPRNASSARCGMGRQLGTRTGSRGWARAGGSSTKLLFG